MRATHRLVVLIAAILLTIAFPGHGLAATVTITQDSLAPTTATPGLPVAATLKVHASACATVLQLGVAIRDSAGDTYDFPGSVTNPGICPAGYTLTTGTRTFPAGTYTEFGFYQDSAGFHDLTQVTLTVASSGTPSDPTRGRTLTFAEEFNSPIAYGSRWVASTTSSYRYGTHNPDDDKLDWLLPSDVSVAGGVATFTAQPSSHVLENGKRAWTTGLLTTEGSTEGFQVRTGDYIEASVQLSTGMGAWPALWTWKNGDSEIDKFEYHPDNPNLLELTNHVNPAQDYYSDSSAVNTDCWVRIGTVYGATSVDWYVNGVRVFSDGRGVGTSWSAYIILNLSIDAGTWHPAPQNSTPITFAADYVHVWR